MSRDEGRWRPALSGEGGTAPQNGEKCQKHLSHASLAYSINWESKSSKTLKLHENNWKHLACELGFWARSSIFMIQLERRVESVRRVWIIKFLSTLIITGWDHRLLNSSTNPASFCNKDSSCFFELLTSGWLISKTRVWSALNQMKFSCGQWCCPLLTDCYSIQLSL